MRNKNILISGAGIAGLTLAYWLKKFGFEPVVVEQYPELRQGGYMIDFFGLGVDVAERMGALSDLQKADVNVKELVFVNERNRKVGGFSIAKFKSLFNNRAFSVLRSSVSQITYEHIKDDIEIRFGMSVKTMQEGSHFVNVTFSNDEEQEFDLVIGADGLHSRIRQLAFGPEAEFEKRYGYYTSSYTIDNFLEDKAFYSYTIPDKQVSIYSLGENKMAAFFVFRPAHDLGIDHRDSDAQKQVLRQEYRDVGWYCDDLLKRMDSAPDFYFDVVSQIKMTDWSKGRISLVGDACDCPSLLSGQGAALAMVGAYILAGELKNSEGNYEVAFAKYQEIMRPFIEGKQRLAEKFADSFVPKNKFNIWVRNTFTNLMFMPFVSKWFIDQFLKDDLVLKDY